MTNIDTKLIEILNKYEESAGRDNGEFIVTTQFSAKIENTEYSFILIMFTKKSHIEIINVNDNKKIVQGNFKTKAVYHLKKYCEKLGNKDAFSWLA